MTHVGVREGNDEVSHAGQFLEVAGLDDADASMFLVRSKVFPIIAEAGSRSYYQYLLVVSSNESSVFTRILITFQNLY